MRNQLKGVFYWDQAFLVGWVFPCPTGEKRSLVGLVDQLLQHAPNQVAFHAIVLRLVTRGEERLTSLRTSTWEATNQVATVERAFAWLCRVILHVLARVRTSPRSYRVSNESIWNCWFQSVGRDRGVGMVYTSLSDVINSGLAWMFGEATAGC